MKLNIGLRMTQKSVLPLTTKQARCTHLLQDRLLMLELAVNLDVEMAYHDRAMARIIYRRRREAVPIARPRARRCYELRM